LSPGTRLGAYEILTLVGSGGMGEVYRAKDTTLGREVALKILPASFTNDPDRVARFHREAQVLASLNHPHIGQIYGLENANGTQFLVLELVDGESLNKRIARGRIPVVEALNIVKQIADALEAAHDKGIIHRDLKPANIALTKDGSVKLLDFGLAKATEAASGPSSLDVTNSPTITSPAMLTGIGVLLGTVAYMSPEQATGKPADRRSDIWALGVVLLEMLTGRPVFPGETVPHVLAAVLKSDPDWTALPASTPAPIRRLLRRCLEKDRRRRLADAADARLEIVDALAVPSAVEGGQSVPATRRAVAVASVALLIGGVVAAAATWMLTRPAPATRQPVRFSIVPPAALTLALGGFDRDLALSPDGTHLVYVSIAGQLMVRAMDQLDAVAIGGVTDARSPFFSPDGRWVGFFSGGGNGELKKVAIAGGPPLSLCRYSGGPRGASWGTDDMIVFATADPSSGLLRVSAAGGTPTILTTPDKALGGFDHLFPTVLPGGRAVLFTIASERPTDIMQVAILDLTTGRRTILVSGGSQAEYVEPGYLVYAVAGSLRVVRFDPRSLTVANDPVPIVEQVRTLPNGAAEFSVSRQGALVYVSGGATGATRSLVWVTRQGQEATIPLPPRAYVFPRLSPDGTRVALDIRDQESDIWIADLARTNLTRLTDPPGPDTYPVWTPDSRRIIFASARAGRANLFWQSADNTGRVERLTTGPNSQLPTAIAPDGTRLIIRERGPTGPELRVVRVSGSSGRSEVTPAPTLAAGSLQSERLAQTALPGINGEVSPDGHWLAYQSSESGQAQIYVRPFPNVDGGHWTISTNGGTRPAWARSGEELFYLDGANAMMAVSVHTTPTFRVETPTKLFDGRYYANEDGRTYDVSADGQRFIMIKPIASDQPSALPNMVIVLNWLEELKARVPIK